MKNKKRMSHRHRHRRRRQTQRAIRPRSGGGGGGGSGDSISVQRGGRHLRLFTESEEAGIISELINTANTILGPERIKRHFPQVTAPTFQLTKEHFKYRANADGSVPPDPSESDILGTRDLKTTLFPLLQELHMELTDRMKVEESADEKDRLERLMLFTQSLMREVDLHISPLWRDYMEYVLTQMNLGDVVDFISSGVGSALDKVVDKKGRRPLTSGVEVVADFHKAVSDDRYANARGKNPRRASDYMTDYVVNVLGTDDNVTKKTDVMLNSLYYDQEKFGKPKVGPSHKNALKTRTVRRPRTA